jgi:SAM-dependent methyltransferase
VSSIAFDRAADYYDETRRVEPATHEALMGHLAAELRGRGRCLEVGVGTGRIALDLHGLGIPMTGIDLSPAMLRKLVEKTGGRAPFPLAVADATALPLADRSAGAAVVCHVLHLIGPWRRAVEELVRVVRPGGAILVESSTRDDDPLSAVSDRFWSLARPDGRPSRGMQDIAELDALLGGLGFRVRALPSATEEAEFSLDEIIVHYETARSSACWELDESVLRAAAAATREWAVASGLELHAPLATSQTITWYAYDAPPAG